MAALRIIARRFGRPEVLETAQEEEPELGRGEVRVREFAASVSFADLLMREGTHPEKVAALPIHGGYAEYISLPESELTPVPAGLDPPEAVSPELWDRLPAISAVTLVGR